MEGARLLYAVCPRIGQSGSDHTPKLFESESEAEQFLNAEVQTPLEDEAEKRCLSIEEVLAFRAEREELLRKERSAIEDKITNGELHLQGYPPHLQPLRHRDQGWQPPVKICYLADHSGPRCNRTFREFLPLEEVGWMPPLRLDDEIDRALTGRSGDYTCCLGEDWAPNEIIAEAERIEEQEYCGRKHTSIGEIVVKLAHHGIAAFQRLHPNASCAAVAAFCRSWQLMRYLGDACERLAKSETARILAGSELNAAEEAERARVHIGRQLAAFTHEILADLEYIATEVPASLAPRELVETVGSLEPPRAAPDAIQTTAGTGNPMFRADRWEDVEIRFLTDHEVRITAGGTKSNRHYSGLGMEHKRAGKPSLAWQTLNQLARSNGLISEAVVRSHKRANAQKRIQELRRWLRELFGGLASDPLPYIKGTGYRAKFTINCGASYQP